MSDTKKTEAAKASSGTQKAGGIGVRAAAAATTKIAAKVSGGKRPDAAQSRSVAKTPDSAVAKMRAILKDEGAVFSIVKDEADFLRRRKAIIRLIGYQNWVIIGLIAVLILGVPFFMPAYDYYLMTTNKEVRRIISLDSPNITNDVLLAWARTSVMEILTLGFGNFDEHLSNQKSRFTEEGWKNFVAAIVRDDLMNLFSKRQWVLTTVPADDPVVVSQGPNKSGVYEWVVEIPVAMTFTTNNNVTKGERNTVLLTIIRVPTSEKERGIAIKSWKIV